MRSWLGNIFQIGHQILREFLFSKIRELSYSKCSPWVSLLVLCSLSHVSLKDLESVIKFLLVVVNSFKSLLEFSKFAHHGVWRSNRSNNDGHGYQSGKKEYCFHCVSIDQWFSVEQIVDCDTGGQDQGCNGGFPVGAYTYIEQAGGIETEEAYPYTAEGGESGTCKFVDGDTVCSVTGYTTINGETGLYQQLSTASGGPVSVCVDASTWSSYTGGVLTTCGNQVDHCVELTGYEGYGSAGSYWIVRNSWGTAWGETGYIFIEIGQDLCSIGDYATVPQVKLGS